MNKSKAQIAYEAYPYNQNAAPWEDTNDYKKECWQDVVDAVSPSPFKRIKRFVLNSYRKYVNWTSI